MPNTMIGVNVQGRGYRRLKNTGRSKQDFRAYVLRAGTVWGEHKKFAKLVRSTREAIAPLGIRREGQRHLAAIINAPAHRQVMFESAVVRPTASENLDLVYVVKSVSEGGTKLVKRFILQLRRKGLTDNIRRALVDAFNEAAQAERGDTPTSSPSVGATGVRESFIDGANRLDRTGHTDAALDLLYDAVDEMLRRREFPEVDAILRDANVADLSINILIGLLTVTLPARSRLSSRAEFYTRVEDILRQRGEFEEGLLTGLEG